MYLPCFLPSMMYLTAAKVWGAFCNTERDVCVSVRNLLIAPTFILKTQNLKKTFLQPNLTPATVRGATFAPGSILILKTNLNIFLAPYACAWAARTCVRATLVRVCSPLLIYALWMCSWSAVLASTSNQSCKLYFFFINLYFVYAVLYTHVCQLCSVLYVGSCR